MTANLFEAAARKQRFGQPLAERMRPRSLHEITGQPELLGTLTRLLQQNSLPSLILWGPTGVGKTTLGKALAQHLKAEFVQVSAVLAGVKDLRTIADKACEQRNFYGLRTVLFVDEIHRFNKSQQDALLPHVEVGLLTLIGATTENPSFEINQALLSRTQVFVLKPLEPEALQEILAQALSDVERGLGNMRLQADKQILLAIAKTSDGDARQALNTLEMACALCAQQGQSTVGLEHIQATGSCRLFKYDKTTDEHHAVTSALIKSLRGSDPNAAMYYMVRMLESGESPRFILRRLVIFASEDIGNADPQALQVAISALQAVELVGLPEGTLPLTQATLYLACAPKSNSVVAAYQRTRAAVLEHGSLPVPYKLRNAVTPLLKSQGYGANYQYPHDHTAHHVAETYLPEALVGQEFYQPSDQGDEKATALRLLHWQEICKNRSV